MALEETLRLIDTNILLAVMDPLDALHEKASRSFNQMKQEERNLILVTPVIEETVTYLLYKQRGALAKEFIDHTHQDPTIIVRNIEDRTLRQAFNLAESHQYQPKISLTDWVLIFLALTWKIQLVTFDKQLHNLWKKLA